MKAYSGGLIAFQDFEDFHLFDTSTMEIVHTKKEVNFNDIFVLKD